MIIPVDETNLLQAAAIHSVSWKESHRAFCSPDFIEAHTPERQRTYIAGKMKAGTQFYMLVEEIPVGIVSVTDSLIEDLYVLPDQQNRGYGTKLLRYAVSRCAHTPTLWILENNVNAERLYRRLGFRETGRKKPVTNGLDEIEFKLMKRMENCDWCSLSEEDKRFQVYESKLWSVFLSDEQDYIGRCILVLKRHCHSLSELTDDEWDELRNLICKAEACLKTVLGATLCNWSCLMNNFYKESAPDPHLHIHVRPRYDKPVMLNGNTYTDSEFGHHYALHKSGGIPDKDKEEVFCRLKEWLNRETPVC